jgi:NAD(P)-dependent dehydrogenase (short-subunit alcohol dehydrogenase family)
MSAQLTQTPLCVVAGVGPGNGAAFARRFAAEGYAVALLARTTGLTNKLTNELPVARAYACDVGDPADDMGAQRSVSFAVCRRSLTRPRLISLRDATNFAPEAWRELRKIRI